jgi:hypothetical protein
MGSDHPCADRCAAGCILGSRHPLRRSDGLSVGPHQCIALAERSVATIPCLFRHLFQGVLQSAELPSYLGRYPLRGPRRPHSLGGTLYDRLFGRLFDRLFGRLFDRLFGWLFGWSPCLALDSHPSHNRCKNNGGHKYPFLNYFCPIHPQTPVPNYLPSSFCPTKPSSLLNTSTVRVCQFGVIAEPRLDQCSVGSFLVLFLRLALAGLSPLTNFCCRLISLQNSLYNASSLTPLLLYLDE